MKISFGKYSLEITTCDIFGHLWSERSECLKCDRHDCREIKSFDEVDENTNYEKNSKRDLVKR